jgi:hypothetical protein
MSGWFGAVLSLRTSFEEPASATAARNFLRRTSYVRRHDSSILWATAIGRPPAVAGLGINPRPRYVGLGSPL